MHAVVVKVTVNDREAAEKRLREEVVPRVSQLPGVVSGYWTRSDGPDGPTGRSCTSRSLELPPVDSTSSAPGPFLLVCVECGRRSSAQARGWRSYLTEDGEAVVFCPECAQREFPLR